MEQKKTLCEGAIISKLHYGIEISSSGSEKVVKKLEGMKSQVARFILGRSRNGWSKSQGYQELKWLSIPQAAIEFSLRLFFKIILTRKPV